MFIVDDRVVFSASDLAAAARCEYALLRGFELYKPVVVAINGSIAGMGLSQALFADITDIATPDAASR